MCFFKRQGKQYVQHIWKWSSERRKFEFLRLLVCMSKPHSSPRQVKEAQRGVAVFRCLLLLVMFSCLVLLKGFLKDSFLLQHRFSFWCSFVVMLTDLFMVGIETNVFSFALWVQNLGRHVVDPISVPRPKKACGLSRLAVVAAKTNHLYLDKEDECAKNLHKSSMSLAGKLASPQAKSQKSLSNVAHISPPLTNKPKPKQATL